MKLFQPLFLYSLLFFGATYTYGQYQGSYNQSGSQGQNSQKMNLKVHAYGKVIDEKDQAVDFATIVLMKPVIDTLTDSLSYTGYKTTTTENNGDFQFPDFNFEPKMKIRVATFGYLTQDIELVMNPKNISMGILQIDFGKIKLKPEDATEIEGVKIIATKPLMKLEADKRVFDVSKDAVAQGGTAIDVLKDVPGVNVDIDGNVQVRNSAPQIYIDGRPTTLTLDQIPADDIDKVEVLTNPSAKFDASGGTSGIINIILKKNIKTGYNGSIRAGIDRFLGYNLGGDFNYRRNKFNISASLNYRNGRGLTTGNTLRDNYLSNDTIDNTIKQKDLSKRNGGGAFARLGIDYLPTNKTSFSLGGSVWRGKFGGETTSDITTDSVYTNNPNQYYYQRVNESTRKMLFFSGQFGFKQLFKRQGEEFTIDASYSNGGYNSLDDYTSDYHLTDINSPISRTTKQKIVGSGDRYNSVIQTDYVLPLNIFKIETGLRAQLTGRTSNNNNYYLMNNNYELMPNPAANYSNIDNVYAAYISLSKQYGKFGYKAGLRAESSNYKGILKATGEEFKINYPLSLFPSAFLSYKIDDKQDLQINYSRRVDRPSFWQIIPFVDSTDILNMSRGNPALKPQFTNNIELQYLNNFNNNNNFLASVYYKYTNHLITRFIERADNGALINTYINAKSSYSTGIEFISTNRVKNWLEIMANVNIYNSKINSDAYQSWSTADRWAWFGKLNLTFKMPSDWTAQLSGIYQSKSSIPLSDGNQGWGPHSSVQSSSQGYIDAYWALDLSVKKMFLNKRLSVTLAVSDIFGTRKSRSISKSELFYQDYNRLSNPYMVRLNVVWTFGKMDVDLFRRLTRGTGESVMSE